MGNKSEPTGHVIVSDIAKKAMDVFHANSETIIAAYLIRHPDVDPADVEVVMSMEKSEFRCRVEPRELHVPPFRALMSLDDFLSQHPCLKPEDYEKERLVTRGWNECRAQMLEAAKAAKDGDGTVVTLLSDVLAQQSAQGVVIHG